MLWWLILGGSVNNGANAGLFAFNVHNAPSNANWNIGASLIMVNIKKQCLPFSSSERKKIVPQKARISKRKPKIREAIRDYENIQQFV